MIKKLLTGLCLTTSLVAGTTYAATDYPTRPITVVVPFSPGGATDILARLLGERLAEKLGQPVVVENKPGAGTMIASNHVARAKPDGYTFLLAASSLGIAPSIYSKVDYDPVKDFTAVTQVASVVHVLEVAPSLPVKTVQELITYLKAHPGEVSYASVGVGTSTHLEAEMFKSMAGVEMQEIPYKGSAPALTDLVAGRVQVMFDAWASSGPFAKSGKTRVLAVTTDTPSKSVPDIPTISTAVPGFSAMPWLGLVAPAGTPAPIVDKIYTEVAAILKEPAVQEKFTSLGLDAIGSDPATFAAFIEKDIKTWGKVAKDANIRLD
ncbi:Bug family tripartite tricarboxylate transporter substrate binding protein [Pollutimonas harenae]|uniref:Tripartite tricarboxylate transporter substrate binding protein n=1 Tax=Pollutimonas harenae TaxID=657015 RepID=A0A853GSP1_9BURK|nr:tripartite tricarboxylate transporter substrate binding protein [Pollutimonas harenae]NYT85177.1 tripartite tricarboxylate transporter substrate binding protein [Pollutimonas harenae]TEA72445.1 tripartite tricarboxylate transporter substrate binding protein [Pollutimonas harenae]